MIALVHSKCGVAAAIHARDRLTGETLDVAKKSTLLIVAQRYGDAFRAGAGGAPNTMNVAFRDVGKLVIDDVRHLVDVDAPRGDVRCDEPANAPRSERAERRLSLPLALVAVDCGDLDAGSFQMASNFICAALSAREDERALHRRVGEQLDQKRFFPLPLNVDDFLRHAIGRFCHRRYGNAYRIAQHVTGKLADFARHGGGKEKGLPLCRNLGNDLADGPNEAHVEHLVGFIQNKDFRAR